MYKNPSTGDLDRASDHFSLTILSAHKYTSLLFDEDFSPLPLTGECFGRNLPGIARRDVISIAKSTEVEEKMGLSLNKEKSRGRSCKGKNFKNGWKEEYNLYHAPDTSGVGF